MSVLLIALASTILLPFTGIAQDDTAAPGRREMAIEGLSRILNRLDQEIMHLQNADSPALEERLEELSLLLENLIADLETPPAADQEGPRLKEQIIKLDLTLHRLVTMLERIATANEPEPSPKARETIAELRIWIDGYIAGVTANMDRNEAREFERMSKALLGEVGKHLARIAQQAQPNAPEKDRLDFVIERIEALLARLDRFIIRTFGRTAVVRPLHQP
jgi:hypothetical protein